MKILAIRYTTEAPTMRAFYGALGLGVDVESRTGDWVELAAQSGSVALHVAEPADTAHPAGMAELAFEADEVLEEVKARLEAAGFPGAVIIDESFGRSLRIADPDGVLVHVNELDRELFT